ncbi:MAG: hypothetical protein ACI9TV_000798 [Sulfurimonas sp.]|jgi:hypothetical protein|uniref:hypothetical protein n=1 Tax=Sulfurimonas sp. TaxID=2022749 RepID=UPI0039E38476
MSGIYLAIYHKGLNMETSTKYQEHTSIMKGLNLHSDFAKARETYKEDFEKIYEQAIDAEVNVSNAKEFVADLTVEELETLQNYTQLADAVEVNELSDEGAYNLLMHFYEKYDFDNDGFTEDGEVKTISLIPQDIDNDLKEAFVNALNNSDEDNTLSILVLTLDINKVKNDLAQHINNMPASQKDYLRENTSLDIDLFVQTQLKDPYEQKQITFDTIMTQLDNVLNPESSESTSFTLRENIQAFTQTLKSEYQSVKDTKANELEDKLRINDLVANYKDREVTTADPLVTLLQA